MNLLLQIDEVHILLAKYFHTQLKTAVPPLCHINLSYLLGPTSSTTTETKFKNSFSKDLEQNQAEKKIKNRIQASEDFEICS